MDLWLKLHLDSNVDCYPILKLPECYFVLAIALIACQFYSRSFPY